MIRTIQVDRVLSEAVATPYRVLVTRPTGAAVRGRIQAALAEADGHTALLDFSEVDCLDFSCADEVVAKLLRADAALGWYVVLRGLCEEKREAIEHVLVQQGLAVAAVLGEAERSAGRGLALLGAAASDLRRAFEALCGATHALDAAELAATLGWPAARAAEALDRLAELRVVRSAPDGFRLPIPHVHDAA
jgi:hypothetical protein